MSQADSELATRPPAAAEPDGLGALQQQEAALEADWERLQSDGHGYSALRERLADPELSKEERAELLRAAHRTQTAFLDRLDALLRALHSHFIRQVSFELERAVEVMQIFYGKRRLFRVRRTARRLARLRSRYLELESQYGTPGDHRRILTYQRFYAGAVRFSEQIRRLDPTAPTPAAPSLVELAYKARRGIVRVFRQSGNVLRLLGAFASVLYTVLSRAGSGPGTPFTRKVDAFFGALGRVSELEVEVSGRENLSGPDPDAITLHTPAHRHGFTDNVTFSHLGVADYLVFNAIDQVQLLPQFLKNRVAETRGLIAVGKGRGSSVDGLLGALADGTSRNVLIYPEGTVSEGFRGTRPPRKNFGSVLVRRLREAGHRVRLLPVTYLDNARFLDLPPRSKRPEERKLRVVVSPALESPSIDAVLDAGGGEMLNHLLRLAWLEQLPTDGQNFLGQDRIAAIESRLDRELDGLRYWGSVEPAPVSDLLDLQGPDPIVPREEPFGEMRIRVLQIPESARDAEGRIVLPGLRAPDSNELLIGIRPPCHIYLAAGSRRFDGDIFRPLEIKQRDTIPPGIVIRLMHVPVKSVNAIGKRLEELGGREQRTLTCANSACRLIAQAANIEIDDHADLRPFLPSHVLPTRTIRKIIERGLLNHGGEPVETQIYATGPERLEETLAVMRKQELKIARDHARMLGSDGSKAAWHWVRGRSGRD